MYSEKNNSVGAASAEGIMRARPLGSASIPKISANKTMQVTIRRTDIIRVSIRPAVKTVVSDLLWGYFGFLRDR